MRNFNQVLTVLKPMILLVIINSGINCYSQEIIIKTKDGKRITTKIQATSNTSLLSNFGSYDYTMIDSVFFKNKEQRYQSTYDRLNSLGIPIVFDSIIIPETEQRIIKIRNDATPGLIIDSLEKYRKQSQTGKGLQLIGIIVSSASLVIQYSYNKKYQNDYDDYLKRSYGPVPQQKFVSPAIPLAALGISLIGFGIDLDANRHLKFY